MATYQTGTFAITHNWANVIGDTLDSGLSFGPTAFFIDDTDGNMTKVVGTGFTYNAGMTAVTGGTITGLQRYVGVNPNGEQISGISLNAATFWADAGSQKLAAALNGSDTFRLSQTQLTGSGGAYAIDGYGGGGTKTIYEAGVTSDQLLFVVGGAGEQFIDVTSQKNIPVSNINAFVGGSGETDFVIEAQPAAGALSLSGGSGPTTLSMEYTIAGGSFGTLDLTNQGLFSIDEIDFDNSRTGTGESNAEIVLDANQFSVSGISPDLTIDGGSDAETLFIRMSTATSFTAAGFSFTSDWNNDPDDSVFIDGSASSSNLTITGPNTGFSKILGGSGNDSLQGGTGLDIFEGSIGNDTINGGAGTNTINYSGLTTSGLVAIIQGGSGTVNKGGGNGIDHLTKIQKIDASDAVFYADANENINGELGFNYLIELSTGVNLAYFTNFSGISEFVSNTGANTVSFAGDNQFAYLYGSTGNDTLTLGIGGGYLFGEGGSNTLNGGANGTNIFEGGSGGSDTMNGGGGTAGNFYYVDGNDEIDGAGAFNTAIELVSGVTALIGGSQYFHVQELVADGGANTVSVAAADSDFVYLYGGTGNDTLSTGSGGGYLIGEGGTNTLTGGGGTNVFVADGDSGVDTMNGGSGSNIYLIDANSVVHGAGTFNTVEELQQNASLVLGSTQLGNDIQQVVFYSGTNSADFHTATGSVFLYGGSGNDTLLGGTVNDFLFGGTGTNTFEFEPGWGKDTIEDWTAGTNNQIDLTALAIRGVHALTDLTQTISGGNDVITTSHTGSNSMTLLGVGSALTASSFQFA